MFDDYALYFVGSVTRTFVPRSIVSGTIDTRWYESRNEPTVTAIVSAGTFPGMFLCILLYRSLSQIELLVTRKITMIEGHF